MIEYLIDFKNITYVIIKMQGVRKNMKCFLFDFTAPIRNNISMKIKFPVISFIVV